jgi:hypothetical protein
MSFVRSTNVVVFTLISDARARGKVGQTVKKM